MRPFSDSGSSEAPPLEDDISTIIPESGGDFLTSRSRSRTPTPPKGGSLLDEEADPDESPIWRPPSVKHSLDPVYRLVKYLEARNIQRRSRIQRESKPPPYLTVIGKTFYVTI